MFIVIAIVYFMYFFRKGAGQKSLPVGWVVGLLCVQLFSTLGKYQSAIDAYGYPYVLSFFGVQILGWFLVSAALGFISGKVIKRFRKA